MKVEEKIEGLLTKENLRLYLDTAIRNWRKKRREADETGDEEGSLIASCYVDAYQCVRVSMLDELLKQDEEDG